MVEPLLATDVAVGLEVSAVLLAEHAANNKLRNKPARKAPKNGLEKTDNSPWLLSRLWKRSFVNAFH